MRSVLEKPLTLALTRFDCSDASNSQTLVAGIPLARMARANGIPATNVWEFDASEQSNRVSANVSGFSSTLRISLNDNLLKRCTLPEIETTMGHEMGHYVLNHSYKGLVM